MQEVLRFVRGKVSQCITTEDIGQYAEVLSALMGKSGCSVKLLEEGNKPSLVGMIAYSFEQDVDLDDWIVDFCNRNDDYIPDQAENYEYMKKDLQQFLKLA